MEDVSHSKLGSRASGVGGVSGHMDFLMLHVAAMGAVDDRLMVCTDGHGSLNQKKIRFCVS